MIRFRLFHFVAFGLGFALFVLFRRSARAARRPAILSGHAPKKPKIAASATQYIPVMVSLIISGRFVANFDAIPVAA